MKLKPWMMRLIARYIIVTSHLQLFCLEIEQRWIHLQLSCIRFLSRGE